MLEDISKAITMARQAQKYFTDAEAKLIHAEMMGALAGAKMELAELQTALIEKDQRIAELQTQATTTANLTARDNYYWLLNDDETEDGPFCMTCQDVDNKLIRLHCTSDGGHWCNACILKKTT